MTTTKDWEAEFDSHRPWTYLGFEIDAEGKKVYLTDEIKAFIHSLLLAQKNELRGVVESIREKAANDDSLNALGYVEDILAALDV